MTRMTAGLKEEVEEYGGGGEGGLVPVAEGGIVRDH